MRLSDKEIGRDARIWVSGGGSDRIKSWKSVRGRFHMNASGELPVELDWVPKISEAMGCVGVSASFDDGVADYEWSFEGDDQGQQQGGGGPKNISKHAVYSLDGTMNKSPITMHPNIGRWMSYKGKDGSRFVTGSGMIDGVVQWATKDPMGQSTRRGMDLGGNMVSSMNPMYGVQDFYESSVVWQVERVVAKADLAGLLVGLGQIATPEGDPPKPGEGWGRNWLYSGASFSETGNRFVLRKTWMLSGNGGWSKYLYGGGL